MAEREQTNSLSGLRKRVSLNRRIQSNDLFDIAKEKRLGLRGGKINERSSG